MLKTEILRLTAQNDITTQPPRSDIQSNSFWILFFDGMTGIELFNCRSNK